MTYFYEFFPIKFVPEQTVFTVVSRLFKKKCGYFCKLKKKLVTLITDVLKNFVILSFEVRFIEMTKSS